MTFTNYNIKDLDQIAKAIIKNSSYKIMSFQGDLGAGKTTLIKHLVKHLGSKDNASSPSFSIVNEYHAEANKIFHFDFYRIDDENEAHDLGFDDYLNQNAWVFIEWPEKIINLIDFKHHKINISFNAQLQRELTFL